MNTGDIDPNLYHYVYESMVDSFNSMFIKAKSKLSILKPGTSGRYLQNPERHIKGGKVALWVGAVIWISAVLWASPDLRDSDKRLRHEYYCPGPHVF